MTKRDSSFADLESPRILMSFPRRHQVVIAARHESGAASSDRASSSSNAMQSWGSTTGPHHRPDDTRSIVESQHFGYASMIPSVPLPSANPPGPPGEAYIPVTIGTVTEPSGAPHPHFQRGHSTSPFRPCQSPDGDRSRSTWSGTKPSSGVLLQWNCWSCPLIRWWTHQQLGPGHSTCQLLASLLPHS